MDQEKFNRLQQAIDEFGRKVAEICAEGSEPPKEQTATERAREEAMADNLRELNGLPRIGTTYKERYAPPGFVTQSLREHMRRSRAPWPAPFDFVSWIMSHEKDFGRAGTVARYALADAKFPRAPSTAVDVKRYLENAGERDILRDVLCVECAYNGWLSSEVQKGNVVRNPAAPE